MYNHYLRIDESDLDANANPAIILIYSSADKVYSYITGDEELIINDMTDSAQSRYSQLPRQASLPDYIDNFDSNKKYSWDSSVRTFSEFNVALNDYKTAKNLSLDNNFKAEIAWTDEESLRYYKRKTLLGIGLPSGEEDRHNDVVDYYQESRDHLASCKSSVDSAADKASVDAVIYSPTHAKSREEIQGEP